MRQRIYVRPTTFFIPPGLGKTVLTTGARSVADTDKLLIQQYGSTNLNKFSAWKMLTRVEQWKVWTQLISLAAKDKDVQAVVSNMLVSNYAYNVSFVMSPRDFVSHWEMLVSSGKRKMLYDGSWSILKLSAERFYDYGRQANEVHFLKPGQFVTLSDVLSNL